MTRSRLALIAASSLSAFALAVACGAGDDNNNGGDDSSATDSGSGADTTVGGDSGPPAEAGPGDSGGPFCNVSPCAVSIGIGGSHSCAVLSDGTVHCWGANLFGELGSGTVIDGGTVTPPMSATPLSPSGITNATMVAGGGFFAAPDYDTTCAVRANKTIFCWGSNVLGELGEGDASIPSGPTPVSTLITNGVDVSGGLFSMCAVLASGDVACWGDNDEAQIAQPAASTVYPSPTVLSAGGTQFAKVSVGVENACALSDDGHVWCWGLGDDGENGRYTGGGAADEPPMAIASIDSALDVAAGYVSGCAIKSDNSVVCWGLGTAGILGRGGADAGPFDPTPQPIAAPSGKKFTSVIAHTEGYCALADDKTVWCWGAGVYGALGSGTADAGNVYPQILETPTQVPGLTDVIQISSSAYGFHTCALINGGAVKCWGFNQSEQLGYARPDGGDIFSIAPVSVTF
ncbi:MAG: RCC1 domain-containing protein [Polyangiaceae bacterium]